MLKLKNIALVCILTIFGLNVQAQEKDNPTSEEDKKNNQELSETQDDPMMDEEYREDYEEVDEEYQEDLDENREDREKIERKHNEKREDIKEDQLEDREDLREEQLEENEELREDRLENREEQRDKREDIREDQIDQQGNMGEMNRNKHSQLEQTQSEIENAQLEIYTIVERHPDFTYKYDLQNNTITAVKVEGVSDPKDAEKLEKQLLELAEMRQNIENQPTSEGIYFVTEEEPKPKDGYEKLYNELYSNIQYPEAAERAGVEGNVYVKFIVDHEGNVDNVTTISSTQPEEHFAIQEMEEVAKEAVKNTSGEWEPAKVGGVAVSQWVVLPVQFKVKTPPSLDPLVMDEFDNENK